MLTLRSIARAAELARAAQVTPVARGSRRKRRPRGLVRGLPGLLLVAPLAAGAQETVTPVHDSSATPVGWDLTVPPWIGEELNYKVKYGIFGIGSAVFSVPGLDTIGGWTTYAAEMQVEASVLGYEIAHNWYSWIDAEKLFSRRFLKDDPGRPREYDFFPEERRVHQIQHEDTTWSIRTSEPLDDLAFVYLARTLPLEVGQTYEYNQYFKEENNPIILKVLRKDKRKVGAGEFNTIVVQPIIPESSLFAEGGNAEVHFSDDRWRTMVYLKVDGPVLPFNLTLHLEEFREGVALGDDAEAGEREGDGGSPDTATVSGPPGDQRRDPPR